MLLDALTGWILFAGLLLGIGTVVGGSIIVPAAFPEDESLREGARRRSASLGMVGSLLGAGGLGLYLVRQVREFRDPFVPLGEDLSLLMSTAWGTTWIVATILTVLLLTAMSLARAGRVSGWWVATPLALALGFFPGLTGHARGADNPSLALFLDGVHVWAAGAWLGGLALVLYLEARENRASSLLSHLVPAFSPVAVASVAVLVLSGLYGSWSHLEGVGALATTTYGRTLSLKLIAVLVVLVLGARNFRILTPRLGTEEGVQAMRRSAAAELAVAQLILVVTAVLVRTSPMGR